MAAVHEFRRFHSFISLKKPLKPILVEGTNRSAEISIDFRIIEVNLLALVVGDDPREDRVLWQIGERSIAGFIQIHDILEVRDLSGLPLEGDIF